MTSSSNDDDILLVKHYDLQERLCSKNLDYTYFDVTEGNGACFFNAISEIFNVPFYENLLNEELVHIVKDLYLLRCKVIDFIRFYDDENLFFREKKNKQIILLRSEFPNLTDDDGPIIMNTLSPAYIIAIFIHFFIN